MTGLNHTQRADYRDRVCACWLGKNIGGTLGMPYEGVPDGLELSFYDPVPTSAVANDDLDLQLLWLVLLERHGANLGHTHLAEAWKEYQVFAADEYGVARWNLRRGISPPLSGLHNNSFQNGMGAVIRSEIWACVFPGRPDLAARYAAQDASVDHAGDGVWAEVFLAAFQSGAFVADGPVEAITVALELLPESSSVRAVVADLVEMYQKDASLESAKQKILECYSTQNFTDCVMNLGFIMLGLLWGRGDFARTLLISVNCGQDTDCTGASVGATFGILYGTQAIDEAWKQPIGDKIVAAEHLCCLPMPKTLDELTDRTLAMAKRMECEDWSQAGQEMIYTPQADPIDDQNGWRIRSLPEMEGSLDAFETMSAGDEVGKAISVPEIILDANQYCPREDMTVYLQTYIHSNNDVNGWLMMTAEAGMTAWLDDRMIVNYHGRRHMIPAFHRTEGGVSVPVSLEAGQVYLLKVRLIGMSGKASRKVVVAVGETNCDFAIGVSFHADQPNAWKNTESV